MLADPSSSSILRNWPASRAALWLLLGVVSGLVGGGIVVFLAPTKPPPPAVVLPPPVPIVPASAAEGSKVVPVAPVVQPVPQEVTRAEWIRIQNELKRLRADAQHLRTQLASLEEHHRTLYANWRKTETWRRNFLKRVHQVDAAESQSEAEEEKPEPAKPQ